MEIKKGDMLKAKRSVLDTSGNYSIMKGREYEVAEVNDDGTFSIINQMNTRADFWINEISYHFETEYDYINPSHYQKGGQEVIEMMEDIWGPEKLIAHCEMCAFKYRMRVGEKPNQPVERDLEKARWYENKAQELKNRHELKNINCNG